MYITSFCLVNKDTKTYYLVTPTQTSTIYSDYEDDDDVSETPDTDSNFKIYRIEQELYKKLQANVKLPELGITASGFDTKAVTPEIYCDCILMRSDNHPALWPMYITPGGRTYRAHCSSREKRYMIQQYDKVQAVLHRVIDSGFQELNSDSEIYNEVYAILNDTNLVDNRDIYSIIANHLQEKGSQQQKDRLNMEIAREIELNSVEL